MPSNAPDASPVISLFDIRRAISRWRRRASPCTRFRTLGRACRPSSRRPASLSSGQKVVCEPPCAILGAALRLRKTRGAARRDGEGEECDYCSHRVSPSCALRLEKPVLRPRQAEIFAQRLALVFAAEDAAPLQFRHHAIDEVVEPAGQVRELHGEAVGAFGRRAIPPSRRRWSWACRSWRGRNGRRAAGRVAAR